MIKILIVEDQSMVLGALSALIDLEPDMQVVGSASNGREALAYCQQQKIDVVVTDVEMPQLNGLELAEALQSSAHNALVMILTTFSRAGYVRRALEAGVRAYLLKDAPASERVRSVRLVMAGGTVISPELMRDAWEQGSSPLSNKEHRILSLVLGGSSTEEIARQLSLSTGTVRNYIHLCCQKLQVNSRAEAAEKAQSNGWL